MRGDGGGISVPDPGPRQGLSDHVAGFLSLPGIFTRQDAWYGGQEYARVEPERPVSNQEQIEPAALRISQVASASNLPKAGETRFHAKHFAGRGAIVFYEFIGSQRPRAHQGQVAAYHMP